ncbi:MULTISPECIES: hypothetical protein [unclassified Streptomyces]|uniref:hypothetical protein n=1 Tax=unclassified Streptomyces TaxID=2593676 RepID=UPI0004BDD9E4|nr:MULTISPECIES: hypothetical protein [unclassified Streptomyces]
MSDDRTAGTNPPHDTDRKEAAARELTALVGDIEQAANRHSWPTVAYAADTVRADRPGLLLAFSSEALVSGLADALPAGGSGAPARPPVALADLYTEPLGSLHADRVLLAMGCAELLGPDELAAAADLATRPAGSVAVVLTGAEELAGPGDVALVEGRFLRMLDDGSGAPAVSGLLLWSGPQATPPADAGLGERLAADASRLASFVSVSPSPVPSPEDTASRSTLLEREVAHLLDLAAEVTAGRRDASRDDGAGKAAAAAAARSRALLDEAYRDLRRVLDHEVEVGCREVEAGLRTMEQDLLRGLDRHLAQHRDRVPDRAGVDALVCEYLDRGIAAHAATARAAVRARAAKADLARVEMEQRIDAAYVAHAMSPPDRSSAGAARTSLDESAWEPRAGAPAAGRPASGSGMPAGEVLAGGVLGAATGLSLGGIGILLTTSAGAAVGVAVHRYRTEQRLDHAARRGSRVVRDRVDELAAAASGAMRELGGAMRTAAEAEYARAVAELEAKAPTVEAGPPAPRSAESASAAAAAAELADLKDRFAALTTRR